MIFYVSNWFLEFNQILRPGRFLNLAGLVAYGSSDLSSGQVTLGSSNYSAAGDFGFINPDNGEIDLQTWVIFFLVVSSLKVGVVFLRSKSSAQRLVPFFFRLTA
jgi:hypothetical protein